jgi:hypothetical protein
LSAGEIRRNGTENVIATIKNFAVFLIASDYSPKQRFLCGYECGNQSEN